MLCALPLVAIAQTGRYTWEEYDRLLASRHAITALSEDDIFGERLDLYSGELSFSTTDVSIPGNSQLTVAVTRKFTVTNRGLSSDYGGPALQNTDSFADWELDIPRVRGVFAPNWHDDRCDRAIRNTFAPLDEYWFGNHADMPGGGEMLQVNSDWPKPTTGGPYKWVTAGNVYFSCLSSIKNGTGQGFLAIDSHGTKYWFDHMARTREPNLAYRYSFDENSSVYMEQRYKVALYVTRVEDRFGNSVDYTYSNSATEPLKITKIAAGDGRTIIFGYNTDGFVSTVSDGTRTWRYSYNGRSLSQVTLPDNSRWQIAFEDLSKANIDYVTGPFGGIHPYGDCFSLEEVIPQDFTGTITHPSGAKGTFTVGPVLFGRTNVPALCRSHRNPEMDSDQDYFEIPVRAFALTLKSRQISGPGLTTGTWTYAWSGGAGSWYHPDETESVCHDTNCFDPVCLSDDCAGARSVTIIEPDGSWTAHTYGNSYRYNEGKLLSVQTGEDSDVLRTVLYDYDYTYPAKVGSSPQPRGAGFVSEYPRPQLSRVITQDGATFSNIVNGDAFDVFARPLSITKSSSLGYSKLESTEYHDDLGLWVLGQVARTTTDGIETSRTDFGWQALPWKTYAFGKPQQTFSYETAPGTQAGTLKTVTDGNGNVTTLSSWKRGIPQVINYPATPDQPSGASESAVVDNNGWIRSATNEAGYTTAYGYDVMGRLASITPPAEDDGAWNPTYQSFEQIKVSEYGIPTDHWRQVTTTGTGRRITYFDALWRPLIVREDDTSQITATRRVTRHAYDHEGRITLTSYPVADGNPSDVGTHTTYDALGRVTSVAQDSEQGPLTTSTTYLSGFRRQTRNPRGHLTTESFQAWGVPSYDYPVRIDAPEGVTTQITRDAFGKPLQMSRSGPDG